MNKLEKYTSYKNSGVEWLREIPELWEVEKLFGLCNFIRGNSSFSKDELLNNGKYIALQYGKTYKVDEVNEKYKFYVNDEFYKSSQIVNFGDTIFISTSETIEDLGHSAYYKRSDLGLLGGEQILLNSKVDIIDSKYLYFSSKVFSKELQRFATGIKVFRFNINDLKTIYIPLPPKEEQTKIASYLDEKTSQIDKAIELQQNYIAKLKEYKASLIDSVVTGKVKVC
ncbi:MAG: restriction endonuclease subunit S [Campylobacterota bacterium]|nr:restriction endonuclease subunit S [Campylobacterota bacterium]